MAESYEWHRFPPTGKVQFWRRHLYDGSHLIVIKGVRGWKWERRGPHRIRGHWEIHQTGTGPTVLLAKAAADNAAAIHSRRPPRHEQQRTRPDQERP